LRQRKQIVARFAQGELCAAVAVDSAGLGVVDDTGATACGDRRCEARARRCCLSLCEQPDAALNQHCFACDNICHGQFR
jgi:hypothetical protein